MKTALIDRPVTKVTETNLVATPVLVRKGNPCRQRNMAAHNRVATQKAPLCLEEVHRATLAARTACGLAQKFSHGRLWIHPTRQGMAVVAISGDQVVIVSQHADRSDRTRLLAIVKMAKATNFLILIEKSGSLLKSSDQMHLAKPYYGFLPINDRSWSCLYLGHDLSSLLVLLARLCIRTERAAHRGSLTCPTIAKSVDSTHSAHI